MAKILARRPAVPILPAAMELRRDEPVTAEQHTIPALGPGSGGLSARAVAALLGVHERTISRAIRDGRLVATKHGRSYVITPEALRRYRDAHGESQRVEWAPRRPNLTLLRDPGTRAPEPAARMPKFSPAGTMPRLLTSFVGREWELAAIGELMATGPRLLTLTGPGGVGKTRLAIAAATAIAPAFADGVVFVPLAAITEPGLVLPTISRALDIRETPGRPLTKTLAEALQDWRVLLVLDNFEHVLVAAADLARLLEACPGLTALVTSRAPLRLSVEQRFLTPPLTLPAPGHTLADGGLAGNEAIALFVERARSVRHDFAVDGGNAAQLVEICRRLDGLPLAIELAAAWVRVLPPAALLSRLDQRLSLLHGAIDEQPLRLRTMRDAIAWSYDLLAPDEARLFRRLAVFVGGFTLETAEHVAQGERRDSPSPHDPITPSPTSTLDLLAAFIDKSLLQLNADQPDPRYLMLETVREFALERLEEAAEATSIRDRHATWCLELATRAEPELSGAQQTIWFARLETEHPNLRAALSWH
ncbi:MAG: ATP-binding protein, partial [Thermomicrobiales bacterium]